MHCSRCGICCEKTEMLLSEKDIRLLEKVGYLQKKFACFNKQGYVQLRNRQGYCFFHDPEKRRCKAYRNRPQGCRVYPVIYSEEEGVIVDDLCPKGNTVNPKEVEHKTRKLAKLLERIDDEARKRNQLV